MKPRHCVLNTAAILMLASPAEAAISLLDSDYYTATNDAASHTFSASGMTLGGLSLSGGSKLVVTVAGEGITNGVSNNTVTSISYGGFSLTNAIQHTVTGINRRASIWYLDLTGQSFSNTDFVVSYTESQDGLGFGAYVLSGTAAGVSVITSAQGGSEIGNDSAIPITTLTNGEFVVGVMSRNNFDAVGPGGDLNGFSDPLQELHYSDLSGSTAASGSFIAGSAGSYDLVINDSFNSTAVIVGASFAAIPEPSTALLSGLGLLALLRRRR